MSATLSQDKVAEPKPRVRLEFLDGLRGLAALYVALFHVVAAQRLSLHGLPRPVFYATAWMGYGHYAVDVFIVLSGYCLMLPVARSADGLLRGGYFAFFRRRALRILPPYYASFVLTLLLIGLARFAHAPVRADDSTVFVPANLLAHLLLLHNLTAWSSSINIVWWSVATEWQIYFVFALFLLPLWRRLGNVFVIFIGLVVGFLPHLLLPAGHNLDPACFWYIGLFAMGMAGAVVGFSEDARRRRWLRLLPWGWLTIAFGLAVSVLQTMHFAGLFFLLDPLVGAATVSLIVYCAKFAQHQGFGARPLPVRLLEMRWVAALGAFSYSLYLTNIPAMWVFKLVLHPLHLSALGELGARMAAGPAFMMGFAYLFHLAFEKPFMSGFQISKLPAAPGAVESHYAGVDGSAEAANARA